jgi:hypothetical protein
VTYRASIDAAAASQPSSDRQAPSLATEPCTKSHRDTDVAPYELRPHPSYARHGLSVPTCKLSALRERGELAFIEPLTITRDRTIIDGYARWELAKETGRRSLHCIEYDLSEEEALQWLLQRHGPSNGLNAFTRVMLALDLEAPLTEKARSNQQIGGQHKGWSKLTKAEKVHVRSAIAGAAAVSVGNITKVKQLKAACVPDEHIEALHNHEISIHWAWKLRNASPEDQLDALGRFRFEKGLMREVRQRASRRRKSGLSTPQNAGEIVSRLNDLGSDELAAVGVTVLKSPGVGIFITEALARKIGLERLSLWNQNTSYKNSQRIPDTFGTGMRSDKRSATI